MLGISYKDLGSGYHIVYYRQDNSGYCLWNGVASSSEHVAALLDQYCSHIARRLQCSREMIPLSSYRSNNSSATAVVGNLTWHIVDVYIPLWSHHLMKQKRTVNNISTLSISPSVRPLTIYSNGISST